MAFHRHSVMVTLLQMNYVPLYADIEKERRNIYPCGQLRHITWHGQSSQSSQSQGKSKYPFFRTGKDKKYFTVFYCVIQFENSLLF